MRILRLRRGQSEEVNLIALGWNASRYRDWIPAGILAALCATIYLAVRPPLFDNDGYRDHLYGLQPNGFYNFNRILCYGSLGLLMCLVKAVTGLSGVLLHSVEIKDYLAGIKMVSLPSGAYHYDRKRRFARF